MKCKSALRVMAAVLVTSSLVQSQVRAQEGYTTSGSGSPVTGSHATASPTDVGIVVDPTPETDGLFEYWTPKRFKNAKSLPMPEPTKSQEIRSATEEVQPFTDESPIWEDGEPPIVKVRPDRNNRLFEPDPELDSSIKPQSSTEQTNTSSLQPFNVGTFGAHFTSSRLIPLSADTVYPYNTVGKLFLTKPEGEFLCSGAVIQRRIILTAGHCVHSGTSTPGFYKNFRFAPAYRDGAAPYGTWTSTYTVVTTTWAQGGGVVPNAADYAMIEVNDQVINGSLKRIGDVVGRLGYQTQSLSPNHATLLGFPLNLDNGQKMHQVTAGSFGLQSPNAVTYGSDMTGGSSGGPWVQNFGVSAVSQTGGLNPGMNQVIGVTSYGNNSTDPKYQGSSILDDRFISILNAVCAHRVGNCN